MFKSKAATLRVANEQPALNDCAVMFSRVLHA